MAAMGGAGALMGGKGAKNSGRPTTTTQQTNPWRGGDANWFMDEYRGATEDALGIDWGPSRDQNRMYRQMRRGAFGDQGGGGGGGGESMYGGWRRQGGGGGGGGNRNRRYERNNVDFTDYENRVMDESYMDVASDPYLQSQQEYRRGLFDENAAMSRSQALSPFAANAATMGFTGANLAQQGQMQASNERDWLGMENEMFMDERNARRQEAMGANQAWSGREATYDSSGMSADATRAAANAAARAQMYSADQSLRGTMAGVGAQNAANQFNQQMAMYGLAGGRADQARQNQGLGAMGLMERYGQNTMPWQGQFGKTTSTSRGPKTSMLQGALQGGIGGVMGGMGMGGGGSKGGKKTWSPATQANVGNYFNNNPNVMW
jgi:hypothetical protein